LKAELPLQHGRRPGGMDRGHSVPAPTDDNSHDHSL
jgi:hypothetical protein